MFVVAKFTSESQEKKRQVDIHLRDITGEFRPNSTINNATAYFEYHMRKIQTSSKISINSWASGSTASTYMPNIGAATDYIIKYGETILNNPAVKQLEYTGLWTVPGTPAGFKEFVFNRQRVTDRVVAISVALLNVVDRCRNMIALREADYSFFSQSGRKKLDQINKEAVTVSTDVQRLFKTRKSKDFEAVIVAKYKHTAGKLENRINELLASEKEILDATKAMFMKSVGSKKFISTTAMTHYRLDARAPIALKMKDIGGGQKLTIGGNHYSFIYDAHDPQ